MEVVRDAEPSKLAEETELRAEIDRFVQPVLDHGIAIGLCIGLVHKEKTRVFGYGRLSAAQADAPDADTLYEIGSITKAFTGILLADKVLRKQMSLDDPVSRYLPAAVKMPQFEDTPITLLDLATHRSGLPRMPDNFQPRDPENPYVDYTYHKLYAFLSGHQLARKPGEKYEYSNLGMGLMGAVLARHSGCSYESLLKRRILDPLGMQSTLIRFTPEARAHLAPGHDVDGNPVANWDLGALQGGGAIRSTVRDMLRFLQANLRQWKTPLYPALLLAQKSQNITQEGGDLVGLGWHIQPEGNVWHNGGTAGYRTMCAFNPEKGNGVVVLCNAFAHSVDAIGFGLLKLLDGNAPDPLPLQIAVPIDPAVFDNYVGAYAFDEKAVLTVTRDGDRLMAQLTDQRAYRLHPSSETEFFYRVADAQITFCKNDQGAVEKLILHQNGQDQPAKKT